MIRYFFFIIIVLISNTAKTQGKFEVNLNAPFYINDSLVLSAPEVTNGFEGFYNFILETNENITDTKKSFGFPFSAYYITIKPENILIGSISHTQPVSFIYIDPEEKVPPKITNIFFLENGNYKIDLPEISHKLDVYIDSPANNEYRKIKRLLEEVYVKANNPFMVDSLIDFEKKQRILSSYIESNPKSYVALWQIIEDYPTYHMHPNYADNLPLFSQEVKNSNLFKNFENKLIAEKFTQEGNKLPIINFSELQVLTKKDFSNFKLTLIDYWSTTCGPCIKAMPKIKILFNEFKDKGLNVIGIADENSPEGIEIANKILLKQQVNWTNYFDINKDFKKKVNAVGYPLYFLIDSTGKIVSRTPGNLERIRDIISKYID